MLLIPTARTYLYPGHSRKPGEGKDRSIHTAEHVGKPLCHPRGHQGGTLPQESPSVSREFRVLSALTATCRGKVMSPETKTSTLAGQTGALAAASYLGKPVFSSLQHSHPAPLSILTMAPSTLVQHASKPNTVTADGRVTSVLFCFFHDLFTLDSEEWSFEKGQRVTIESPNLEGELWPRGVRLWSSWQATIATNSCLASNHHPRSLSI